MGTRLYRVEDKYRGTAQEFYRLQRRLDTVLRADLNENDRDGYSVASLYFDDLRDSCLAETAEGCNDRRKYRIRIYNDSQDVIKLEVKENRNNRILKKARRITAEDLRRLADGQCIEASCSTEDPAFLFNTAIRTRGLRPKVIVAYERKAYTYAPGNVRITFDRNVRASRRTEEFGRQGISYDFLDGGDSVLDIKYDEFLPGFILQLLEPGNLRQTAYSKYRLCRERYEASAFGN